MNKLLSTKAIVFVFLALTLIGTSGCVIPVPQPSVFSGGIRVRGTFKPIGMPMTQIPLADSGYAGILLFELGPGNGSDRGISGRTNAAGIADNPNARVNASWQVSFNARNPQCIFDPAIRNVGPGGSVFHFECIL